MTDAARQAQDMLDAFAGVGAKRCDLTLTDADGGKVSFRADCPLDRLRPSLATLLSDATARRHNVIVRPRASGPALVQLDDLGEAGVARVQPAAFLVIRTSPGNYQAWVAVAAAGPDLARRLKAGTGADPSASGATRISGSRNFKPSHAPAFPRVMTVRAQPGLVVTPARLEALGLLAPAEKRAEAPPPARASRRSAARGWPDYGRCVQNAPPAKEGGRPDVSRADFTFCLLAIDWGWSAEEAACRLLEESPKARENGEPYARRTAQSAAAAIERRRDRQRD
jgi:hypothetical protein